MVVQDRSTVSFKAEVDRIAEQLGQRDFGEVAQAVRARSDSIINRWRERSIEAMPVLDQMTLEEFEDSIPEILETLAAALERHDVKFLRAMISDAPEHGKERFAQHVSPHNLLAETRILRSVVILELRDEMSRDLTAEEAASFHELFDIIGEYSVLAMIHENTTEHNVDVRGRMEGMHRLADLGTLAAGVAHDAANLMMPLKGSLMKLRDADVSPEVHQEIESLTLIVQRFQELVSNLRLLSIDPTSQPLASADLGKWAEQSAEFYHRILKKNVVLNFDVPADVPKLLINHSALSQALFNLIRNAEHAIAAHQERGTITVRAQAHDAGSVDVVVEDDGPGMPPAVRERCLEPFFGTTTGGSGIGMALVNALVRRAGGSVEVLSPPPQKPHGTLVCLRLNIAG